MDVLASIQSALISGKRDQLMQETNKAVSEGIKPHKILNEGLIPGMDVVGEKFKNDELYIPEVINVANIFKASVEIIKPLLMGEDIPSIGKVLMSYI